MIAALPLYRLLTETGDSFTQRAGRRAEPAAVTAAIVGAYSNLESPPRLKVNLKRTTFVDSTVRP